MNSESLEQMVKNYNPYVEEENESEPEQPQNVSSDAQEETQEEQELDNVIKVTTFSDWFPDNVQNFGNIFSVNAQLRGVDPNKNIIFTVVDPNNSLVRYPYVFREADKIPVLNFESNEMFIYQNNTFQVNYRYSDHILIKTYNLRTGIGVVFCRIESQNSYPVPVLINKYKKFKTDSIEVPDSNLMEIPIEERLNQNADLEELIIKYKQIQKVRNELTTNRDILNFFIQRQEKIQDINHLMQIDNILVSIFG